MTDIAVNPKSAEKLAVLKKDMPQSLLLTGERGVGLATVARSLAGKNLTSFIEPLTSKDEVDHETGTISVDTVRQLYDQTRAKKATAEVIVLDDADRMSPGAGAAFLKLLEEPTENTYFILTSHSPQLLLPTIRSRVQAVAIEPLTDNQAKEYIDSLGIRDSKKRLQLEYLASGLPAELARLAKDEAYFRERAGNMADTRTFLTGPLYDRLLVVHKYQGTRSLSLQLVDSALAVTRRSLSGKPQENLVTQLDTLLRIREKIEGNRNIRLQLMSFVLDA